MKHLLALLLGCGVAVAQTAPGPQGFYRQPTLQGDTLVFRAQGDLWRVGAQGGAATRLTTHPGAEAWPVLLPDGRTLAYVGRLDGAGDVYTQDLSGGPAQRRTWLAQANLKLLGHDGQGRLLLTAPALDGRPFTQLWRQNGTQLELLPVGDATDAALSLDGRTLYFTRHGLRGDNAKAYRGGAMARLWVMALQGEAEARPWLSGPRANDRRALPWRDAQGRERIAFLSDRDGFYNLWSAAPNGEDLRQHTAWKDFDIQHLSLSGSVAVVSRGADLLRVDLNAAPGSPQPLPITLAGDHPQLATRWIKKPQDFLTDGAVSPNGERVVLAVRGRLATLGTQAARRAVLQQGLAGDEGFNRCRSSAFSSDNRSVFAFCDASGEMELWQLDALGNAPPKQLTQGGSMRRLRLAVSPNGKQVAHTDLAGTLYLTELQATGGAQTRVIGRATKRGSFDQLRWHPDGQALVYTRGVDQAAFRSRLWLYTLADDQHRPLTSERYDANDPAFSPDGQWLYFASRRQFTLQSGQSVWADRNMGPAFEPGEQVFALALQPGLRPPFQARDELPEPAKAAAKAEQKDGKADAKPDAKDAKDAKPDSKALPRLVTEGLAERLYAVPGANGRVRDLATDGKRLWWRDGATLRTLALEPGANPDAHSERVRGFQLSGNAKTLLLLREPASPGGAPDLVLVDAGAKLPADLAKQTVRWSDWQIAVNPRDEWRQMFHDAWRLQRDHFYDAGLHGIDWAASRARHEPLLARVGDRSELAELMAQMVGDLSLLHSQVSNGDLPPSHAEEPPAVAGLGARLEPAEGGVRIARLYRGDPELPQDAGPLLATGLDIAEGDLITAVNGRRFSWPQGSVLLQGEAGKALRLSIKKPDGRSFDRIVTPVDAQRDSQLRYQDWRHSRAERAAQASQGRIGYLHLRAMGPNDIADFARNFYAQLDKEALVIDVRFNNGGNIDSWVIEKLLRRAWAWFQPRHPAGSAPYPNMQHAFSGPLAVLINEQTYSDGETFAAGVQKLRLGAVIGTPSSGAGVWLSDSNRLADNGIMRAAETGVIDAEGAFMVEGRGVQPDLLVDNLPRTAFKGEDQQLQAAVEHLLKQLPAQAPAQRTPKPQGYLRPR
ncbi:MAG: PD40 domain-containing protein [Burkholderiales bacterium]|nr:PD40 domain-containing protein [Burkholderiales bacterium]